MKKALRLLLVLAFALSFTITAQAARKVYANMDSNLRKGPGLEYKIYTSVKDGTALKYLGVTDTDDRDVDWYKVSYKNKKLWISSNCASLTAKPSTSARKRVEMTEEGNLRKGPGLKYGIVITVQEGSTLKYLNSTKKDNRGVKWYKVSYYGKAVWVSSAVAVRKNSKTSKTVYTRGQVNLRKGAGKQYKSYTTVDEGTALKYLNKTKEDKRGVKWYKVSYDGHGLWVSSLYSTLK